MIFNVGVLLIFCTSKVVVLSLKASIEVGKVSARIQVVYIKLRVMMSYFRVDFIAPLSS